MSDIKKINYACKHAGPFKTTFSCTNESVEEEFFQECMKTSQMPREICPGINEKALCEQCDYFGRRAEYYSEWDGKTVIMENRICKDIAE